MGVAVDKPGNQPPPAEIGDPRIRGGNRLLTLTDRKDLPATNKQVAYAKVLRRKHAGICKHFKQGIVQAQKGRYITLAKQPLCH